MWHVAVANPVKPRPLMRKPIRYWDTDCPPSLRSLSAAEQGYGDRLASSELPRLRRAPYLSAREIRDNQLERCQSASKFDPRIASTENVTGGGTSDGERARRS
jgi:hypothetical protein